MGTETYIEAPTPNPTPIEHTQPQSLTMNFLDLILGIGIISILGAFIYIGRKLQKLDDLDKCISKVKDNVKIVSDYLTTNNPDFNHKELQSYSPFKLTKEGHDLIKSLKFDEVFEKNKNDFFNFIDSENPQFKYDVENLAIKSIYYLYSKKYMEFLKIFFYNNPERNLKNLAPTLGVFVRDKYFSEHPEITE